MDYNNFSKAKEIDLEQTENIGSDTKRVYAVLVVQELFSYECKKR